MPTIIFITVALLGLLSTILILRGAQKKGNIKNYQHALIMGIGLFFTWFCSFLAPFLTQGLIVKINKGLVLFDLIISVTAGVLAFCTDYFFLYIKSNKNPSSQNGNMDGK